MSKKSEGESARHARSTSLVVLGILAILLLLYAGSYAGLRELELFAEVRIPHVLPADSATGRPERMIYRPRYFVDSDRLGGRFLNAFYYPALRLEEQYRWRRAVKS